MRFAARVAFVAAAGGLAPLAVISACTYAWDLPADGGADGSVEGGADSTAQGTGDGATTDAATTVEAGPGCDSSAACGAAAVCVFADDRCGAGALGNCSLIRDLTGSNNCAPATGGPSLTGGTLFCGCDGTLYPLACTAYEKGLDLAKKGCVAPDSSYFICGEEFCQSANGYCVLHTGGEAHCAAWGICANPNKDCSCTKPACAGGTCDMLGTGATTVTCTP